jgi:hypothetical protein
VSVAKCLCPSSFSTTWRGLPLFDIRTVIVPPSALKSEAHIRVNSP